MRNGECLNGEWGMKTTRDYARIPHSPFAIPHFRFGVSLLEVLISMFILAVGLLSIASLLPVGGYQVQKAMIDDRKSTVGQNAFHEFRTRGMANAENWVGLPLAMQPGQTFPRPLSVAIDPLAWTSPVVGSNLSKQFPRPTSTATAAPWMPRIGLKFVSHQNPVMAHQIAQQIFMARDDTVHEKHPTDPDASAVSKWELDSAGGPIRRQFEGNFSWLATLTPAYFDVTPRGPWVWPTEYHLSIVIFFKRNLNSLVNDDGVAVERQVAVSQNAAHLAGFGLGGGELFVSGTQADTAVRPGNWVMLCGYYGNPSLNMPVFRWYRVVTAGEYEADKSPALRAITLAGPDWIGVTNQTDPSQWLCKPSHVAVFEGCVGVFEKTVHLEGPSVWSN
jgi:type II secretory pathway pseudopilin PulG